jgi:hypothetical protein
VLLGGTIAQFALVQTLVDGAANDGLTYTINRAEDKEAQPIGGFALTPGDAADYAEIFVNITPATTTA